MEKLIWPESYINKVINADCLLVMKQIPDKSIDLILTDPPFGKVCYRGMSGIGKLKEKNRTYESMAKWGIEHKPTTEQMKFIISKAKNYIVWGGNYFLEAFPSTNCFLVWDKQGEWAETCFAGVELALTSFKSVARKFTCRNQGFVKDSRDGKIDHPTPKPLDLFKWCLDKYSKPGDLILDPFLGSGTTAVACSERGRRFIGIEISEKYCAIAKRRLSSFEMLPL